MDFLQDYPFYSSARIRRELELRGAGVRKSWGQNYLIEPNVLRRMAKSLGNVAGDKVLEIGPGLGALSRELLLQGSELYAVEVDPALCTILKAGVLEGWLPNSGSFFLKEGDALKSLQELCGAGQSSGFWHPEFPKQGEQGTYREEAVCPIPAFGRTSIDRLNAESLFFVCGNLPYYISTPLIEGVLRLPHIRTGLFLVQEEFGARILSEKKQSSLGIFLKNFGKWKRLEKIKSTCFYPRPRVDSIVIKFSAFLDGPLAPPEILEKILRMSFHSKRKKLINSWKMDKRSDLSIEALAEAAKYAGISPEDRAEDVPLYAWYECVSYLAKTAF